MSYQMARQVCCLCGTNKRLITFCFESLFSQRQQTFVFPHAEVNRVFCLAVPASEIQTNSQLCLPFVLRLQWNLEYRAGLCDVYGDGLVEVGGGVGVGGARRFQQSCAGGLRLNVLMSYGGARDNLDLCDLLLLPFIFPEMLCLGLEL